MGKAVRLVLALPTVVAFSPSGTTIGRNPLSPPLHYTEDRMEEASLLFTRSKPDPFRFQPRRKQQQRQQPKKKKDCPSSSITPNRINNRHSSSDWLYNMQSLPHSNVLRETRNPILSLAGWATMVSLLHKVLLRVQPTWAANMCVPHSAHSFLVSSIGLLLVFRTNSAYQRFLEGRKIWEQILTVSRNFSRLATLYRDEVGDARLQRLLNLMASFPYLLRHHIRSGCLCNAKADSIPSNVKVALQEPLTRPYIDTRYEGDSVSGGSTDNFESTGTKTSTTTSSTTSVTECFVDKRDLPWRLLDDGNTLQQVSQVVNRPLWVCDRMAQELVGVKYSSTFTSRERLALLSNVDKLTNAIGACERIHQTAVPLNYARHALRSLTLWSLTLPFCLVKDLGLLTGPVTALSVWLLFGVYQIGHSIEDPFQRSLRLSILCDAIRRDVLGNRRNQQHEEEQQQLDDEEEDVARYSAFEIDANGAPDASSSNNQNYQTLDRWMEEDHHHRTIEPLLPNGPKLIVQQQENGKLLVGMEP